MDFYEELLDFFKKPKEETKNHTPEGVCSQCWGHQQYDQKVRILFRDKQIAVGNHKKKYTFMRQFVKEYIDGIRLKDGVIEACPTCGRENDKCKSQPSGLKPY